MKHVLTGLCLALALPVMAAENPLTDSPTWEDMRADVTGDVALQDGSGLFAVSAPYRAEDAATVPVVITQTDPEAGDYLRHRRGSTKTRRPSRAPFAFGPAMHPLKMSCGCGWTSIPTCASSRKPKAGSYMAGRFVKASGGCSAPATKDPEAALADMGADAAETLQTRRDAAIRQRREAQVMIRHPNYSGLQRDQLTQLFIRPISSICLKSIRATKSFSRWRAASRSRKTGPSASTIPTMARPI